MKKREKIVIKRGEKPNQLIVFLIPLIIIIIGLIGIVYYYFYPFSNTKGIKEGGLYSIASNVPLIMGGLLLVVIIIAIFLFFNRFNNKELKISKRK